MDKFFFFFQILVETVGMVLFMVSAVFALLIGAIYQVFFKRKAPVPLPVFVQPPIPPQVEKKAEEAKEEAGMKPTDTTVDYFNKLGQP